MNMPTQGWYDVVQEATGSAPASQEQSHVKVQAADGKLEEDASVDIKSEVPTNAAGNKQPDDIFGPAHEFD